MLIGKPSNHHLNYDGLNIYIFIWSWLSIACSWLVSFLTTAATAAGRPSAGTEVGAALAFEGTWKGKGADTGTCLEATPRPMSER